MSQDNSQNSNAIKTIDILINGHSYAINCPADAEAGLQQSAKAINQFIQGVRKQSPDMSQDKLLVFYALTMQEKAQQLEQKLAQENQANALIDTMIRENQAVLN